MADQPAQIEGPDITNYWQYFSLERDPFAMTAEEVLIYLPSYWEEMLDLAQYLVNYKNQIVVVTGDSGSGKSVFGDLLIAQIGEGAHTVKVPGEPNLTVQRLVEFLGDVFMLPWKPGGAIEATLDEQLQAMQHKEKSCVLLIDNAHLLPAETLEALLYLVGQQSDNQMRFHAVLVGEPNVVSTLQRMLEPAEEGLVHFLSLEPLSLEELQQYLSHRLNAAGWQNDNPMSEEIVARIFRLSEGNPARINRIARRFLLDMLNEQENGLEKSPSKKLLTRLLGAGLIVAILAVLGIWAWRMSNNTSPQTPDRPVISVNGQALSHDAAVPNAALNQPAATVAQNTAAAAAVVPQANVPALTAPAAPSSPTPAATATNPALQPTATPQLTRVPVENTSATVSQAVVSPAASVAAPAPAEKAVEKPVAKQAKTKPVSHVTAKKVSTKTTSASHAASSTKTGGYSIQLVGLTDAQSAQNFIQQNHLQGKVRIVKSNGKVLVYYGKYSSMNAASQDITNFTPAMMQAGPWPVKVKG
ncbi:MAG: ral secretion pathway protein GspA [Gammaproteobacteria bacterium]|nr:ral secretion pathway protein GspA [Gammaproteobacteria bacterium]